MALMWGWGPFAIVPRGEEVQAGDRVRAAIRRHQAEPVGTERSLATATDLMEAQKTLWELVARRIRCVQELPAGAETVRVLPSPTGTIFTEAARERLVFEVMAATMVASVCNIEYELEGAEIMPANFPTQPEGRAFWEARGRAHDTTSNREAREIAHSEKFDAADRQAVETQFLVAAARAYVGAVKSLSGGSVLPEDA